MNTEQFRNYKNKIQDFEKKHCFWISTDDLVYDKNNSQIRKNGHMIEKFKDYAELMKKGTKFPPISVRAMPNGKFELKEGCTRAGGAALVNKKILATDYMDKVEKFSTTDWEDWQAKGNDHPKASPNTTPDIESFIEKQCKNGSLSTKLGFKYDDDEDKFVESAAKHYRNDIYKNSGKDLDFFRRKVKKALLGKVSSLYENYSKEQSFEFYATTYNFSGKRSGDISSGKAVYTFNKASHFVPNVIGLVLSKKIDNPKLKIELVYNVGDLVGKNDKKVLEERKKIEKIYDKINKAYNCFNGLYFLPQIKQGANKENMFKLIKAR